MKYCEIVKKEIDELHVISRCKCSGRIQTNLDKCKLDNKYSCFKLTEINMLKKNGYLGFKLSNYVTRMKRCIITIN